MPRLQIVGKNRRLAAKRPVRILQNRNQVWTKMLRRFPQRLGHDYPVERNSAMTQQRVQLDGIGRCGRPDKAIANVEATVVAASAVPTPVRSEPSQAWPCRWSSRAFIPRRLRDRHGFKAAQAQPSLDFLDLSVHTPVHSPNICP